MQEITDALRVLREHAEPVVEQPESVVETSARISAIDATNITTRLARVLKAVADSDIDFVTQLLDQADYPDMDIYEIDRTQVDIAWSDNQAHVKFDIEADSAESPGGVWVGITVSVSTAGYGADMSDGAFYH